jgi:anti-sigma regulatory factor (Ser/Thr protein kinase)
MASLPTNFGPQPPEHGCRIDRGDRFVEAKFNSDPAHLAPVRTAIESLCVQAGFDAKTTGEIGLAVNEAIANIIRHAYGSAGDMPIHVRAELKGAGDQSGATEIEITLRDWGHGQAPVHPIRPKPPDPLTPGGLGLVCMHNLMDHVLFTPQARGMLLTMRRARPA